MSVCSSAGRSAGGARVEKTEKVKKKKPSQVRRDQLRRSAFLERRNQAAAATPAMDEVNEDEKMVVDKVAAGETRSAGDSDETNSKECDKSASKDTSKDQDMLTDELRKIIKAAVDNSSLTKWIENSGWATMNKEATFEGQELKERTEYETTDENDNIEGAKHWAIKQKQSFIHGDLRS